MQRQRKDHIGALVLMAVVVAFSANARCAELNQGRLMWSAFVCATYAEISGKEADRARLFDLGYKAGHRFIEGIQDGTIARDEREKAPFLGVLALLSGPTVDFMIGRVYEGAGQYAHDDVSKKNDDGTERDLPHWVTDPDLKAVIADARYARSNCDLLN